MSVIKNKNSDEWIAIRDFCKEQIEALREDNDNKSNGPDDTNFLRGQIAFAKSIIELENDEPKVNVHSTEYLS